MTSQFVKDLYLMQWALNANLAAGSDEVRRSEIRSWFDPVSDAVAEALRDWESKGFIEMVKDPASAKTKRSA